MRKFSLCKSPRVGACLAMGMVHGGGSNREDTELGEVMGKGPAHGGTGPRALPE